jgi:hypothetical protein
VLDRTKVCSIALEQGHAQCVCCGQVVSVCDVGLYTQTHGGEFEHRGYVCDQAYNGALYRMVQKIKTK